MKTAEELKGETLVARVQLHNYRYPRHNIKSGDFAIAILDVLEVLEGELPVEVMKGNLLKLDSIVASGKMPKLEEDDEYLFIGTLKIDPEWGPQYDCMSIHLDYDLSTREDQEKFFSYFLTERQIELLFSMYGNPIKFLESKNIGALTKIKGIGPVTATRMCMKYESNKHNGRAYIELKELGLTKHAIDKMINALGSADVVVNMIKENPYSLIKLVRGYGWEKCDKMALAQGFATNCEFRVMAYTQYYLTQQADVNGNSCMDIDAVVNEVVQMCQPITKEEVANYLKKDMWGQKTFDEYLAKCAAGEDLPEPPLFFYSKEEHKIGLFHFRKLEHDLLEELVRLQTAYSEYPFDREVCKRIIKETEEEQGFEYTDEQKRAIWNILYENVSILTGSAGSGKSHTLKPLIKIFNHYGMTVSQCALSGRASSLLSEITGTEGKTIHRLLCYSPEMESFVKTKTNPLDSNVIILDETSMVGEELFYSLLCAIRTGSKLIMLGDIKQLPPLAVGNILNDCIQSGYIKTNILTIIQRQAMKSGIIAQSIHVCEGSSVVKNDFVGEEVRGELKDFKVISSFDSALIHQNIINEFKNLLDYKKIDKDDIQVIVPVRTSGINSCYALNKEIQQLVNGGSDPSAVVVNVVEKGTYFPVTFKRNDRIIVNKNNYHTMAVDGKEVAIFNGNIGHIVMIEEDYMILRFAEQGDVILPKENWWDINLAYAITCHKLQGSQAPYCIVGVDYGGYILLSREWLYTALTRAKKYCALVCQPKAVNYAVRTSALRQKQTWLKKDLANAYIEKMKENN